MELSKNQSASTHQLLTIPRFSLGKLSRLGAAALVLTLAVPPAPSLLAASDSGIRVVVKGLRDNNGRVGCSLFNGPDGFPRDEAKPLHRMWTQKHDRVAVCDFTGVPAGTYAVTVLDDSNVNGKMDFNFIGLPPKGYGFSNDARGDALTTIVQRCEFQLQRRRLPDGADQNSLSDTLRHGCVPDPLGHAIAMSSWRIGNSCSAATSRSRPARDGRRASQKRCTRLLEYLPNVNALSQDRTAGRGGSAPGLRPAYDRP